MDKLNASTGELWLPCVLVMAVMAAGLTGGSTSPNTARPAADSMGVAPTEQNIPARLWQDPLEATDAVRKSIRSGARKIDEAIKAGEILPLEQLIETHAKKDGVPQPDGSIDYLKAFHRVLFLFVALPSDAYPEAAEQRIRSRFAIVSALSTAGYRPDNAQRLGLAYWPLPARSSQATYPLEVFKLDTDRRPMESVRLPGKFDEAVVIYVEENAIIPDQQLAWLQDLSRLLARHSPPARFTNPKFLHLQARYLGPFTSDRLLALLRSAEAEARLEPPPVAPVLAEAMPVHVLAVRPRIEASILREIIHPSNAEPPSQPALQTLVETLTNSPRNFPLCRFGTDPKAQPWIRVERAGFDDAALAEVLVHELNLRIPNLLPRMRTTSAIATPSPVPQRARVVLIGEWDTIYGRALPRSFEVAFRRAGGDEAQLLRFTYLRGLDGQISGNLEKPKSETAKVSGEPVDLVRQLLVSRAPGMAYGRTQVDYIDRLAAQLQAEQRAHPDEPIRAIGILGTDTFDKLLILRSLRKVFPAAQYFTTELDAALSSPDQYDATRNLLVASGFDLRMVADHQRSILPFRDSGQASIYYATLQAAEFSTMKGTRDLVRRPVRSWLPAVYEIGRGGAFLLTSNLPAGTLVDAAPKGRHSPLPDPLENQRHQWRAWISPLIAVMIILLSTLTQYGRLAVKRMVVSAVRVGRALLSLLPTRAGLFGIVRVARRLHQEVETIILLVGGAVFFGRGDRDPMDLGAARPGAFHPHRRPQLVARHLAACALPVSGCGLFLDHHLPVPRGADLRPAAPPESVADGGFWESRELPAMGGVDAILPAHQRVADEDRDRGFVDALHVSRLAAFPSPRSSGSGDAWCGEFLCRKAGPDERGLFHESAHRLCRGAQYFVRLFRARCG